MLAPNSRNQLFVAFDTETTGFQPVKERMLEIAAVKFTASGQVVEKFSELIDPGIPIPESASKVNGLYDEDVRGKPPAKEVLQKFSEFIGSDSILLAHNAEFDAKFTGAEYTMQGLDLPKNEIWDTLPMAREFTKNTGVMSASEAKSDHMNNKKLENLVNHYGFKVEGFHRGLVDSTYVMHLFLFWHNQDGIDLKGLREFGNPRTFGIAKDVFAVQLPLPLMGLKKSIHKKCGLSFQYEEKGERRSMEVNPHTLFKGEKYQFLYATRTDSEFPEAFRLDLLTKPKVLVTNRA